MSQASLNEQLISAWVDGELAGDELAQAEQLVAENPQYAELAAAFRRQREHFKHLPEFSLDSGFADRVLAQAANQKETAPAVSRPAASPFSGGQKAAAAILALAAMLLLTLFVFPQLFTGDGGNLAKSGNTDLVAGKSTGDQHESAKPGAAEDPVATQKNSKPGEFAAKKADDLDPDLSQKVVQADVADSRELKNQIGRGLAKTSEGSGADREDVDQSDAKIASDEPPGKVAQADQTEEAIAAVNKLDQFLVIELDADDWNQVEAVLKKNNIHIASSQIQAGQSRRRGSEDAENDDAAGQEQGLSSLANSSLKRSDSDLEALYVYSSPSQMVGAVQELARNSNARISAFRMGDVMKFSQLQAAPQELRAPSMLRQMPQQAAEAAQKDGAAEQAQSEPPVQKTLQANSKGAAQQLRDRMELSNNRNRSGGGAGLGGMRRYPPGYDNQGNRIQAGNDQQQQTENQAPVAGRPSETEEFAKISEWFGLNKNLGNPQQQIQEYLLLIKTNRSTDSPADAAETDR